jgi:phosphatidate phosphatase APP1
MSKSICQIIFSLAVILSFQAQAETLLVSDIDDTIKVSHVLGSQAALENVPHFNNVFLGMPELYQFLARDSKIKFAYVSNAPSKLMYYPQRLFLSYNSFPEGEMYLKQNLFDKDHKVNAISNLILTLHPTQLILIGDNGEKDSETYAEIQKRFPQIPTQTFIHQLYSVNSKSETGHVLQPGQIGYASAVDLAFQLKKSGSFNETSYQTFLMTVAPPIVFQEDGLYYGSIAFPAWLNCKDLDARDLIAAGEVDAQLFAYSQKIQMRCR